MPLMANENPQTGTELKEPISENEQQQPEASSSFQMMKAKLFKVVSYFSGDMKVFGEWMKGY